MTATLADLRRSLDRTGPYGDGVAHSWLFDNVWHLAGGGDAEIRERLAEHVVEHRQATSRANLLAGSIELPIEMRACDFSASASSVSAGSTAMT